MGEKASDADYYAARQRLLNAEMAKIHEMVGKSSFVQSMARGYQINMHQPSENASEINSKMGSLAKYEAGKSSSANADFIAQKRDLLSAAMNAVRHMTR